MGAHLLADKFARRIVAGPYLQDEDAATPSKEPRRDPLSPNSFNDDPGALAPPKMPPQKPHPRGIPPRPNVPPLMRPESLQIQPQPPMPGEMPGMMTPGETGDRRLWGCRRGCRG